MLPNTESPQPDTISNEKAWLVTNAFREAVLAKGTTVCDSLDLPHRKALVKEALLKLIRETEDISARSKFTMLYLSLAEFQNTDTISDRDLRYKTMVEESEKLLTDLRRLERSH